MPSSGASAGAAAASVSVPVTSDDYKYYKCFSCKYTNDVRSTKCFNCGKYTRENSVLTNIS